MLQNSNNLQDNNVLFSYSLCVPNSYQATFASTNCFIVINWWVLEHLTLSLLCQQSVSVICSVCIAENKSISLLLGAKTSLKVLPMEWLRREA